MNRKWFRGGIKSVGVTVLCASSWLITEARASNNYTNVVLADNPAGYWRLGEASTNLPVADLTANSNNGTYLTAAQLGLSGAIVGDSDTAASGTSAGIAMVPNSASLRPTNAITVEMWLTASSLPLYASPLMKASNSSWIDGYGFFFAGGGKLDFFVNNWVSGAVGATFPTTTAYEYVVGTFNGSALDIYTNGSLAATFSYTASINESAAALTIGDASSFSAPWQGKVDDVAIYGYALSPTQVLAHYNAGISANAIPEPTSLVMLAIAACAILRHKSGRA